MISCLKVKSDREGRREEKPDKRRKVGEVGGQKENNNNTNYGVKEHVRGGKGTEEEEGDKKKEGRPPPMCRLMHYGAACSFLERLLFLVLPEILLLSSRTHSMQQDNTD